MPLGVDDNIWTVLNYKTSHGFFCSAAAHWCEAAIEQSECVALAGIEWITSAGRVWTSRGLVAMPGGKTWGDAQMPCLCHGQGVIVSYLTGRSPSTMAPRAAAPSRSA